MDWKPKTAVVTLGLALFAGLVACGDATRTDGPSDYDTKREAIRVVPKFEIDGTHDFPENVRFDELGLSVASITLTPAGDDNSVAYSTSEPEAVNFDVAAGSLEREGTPVDLPESGKFDVTLRLEPVGEEGESGEEESESTPYSLALSGYVAGTSDTQTESDGEQDGNPIPVPADPDEWSQTDAEPREATDRETEPKHWMRFEYSTRESARYTLDEVEVVEGSQYLTFSFDAEEWASEIAKPVERAVRSEEEGDSESTEQAVDVTRTVDSRGEGSRSLGDHVSVRTVQSGGGGGL